MPTRKQRRRREKSFRHEWEYVEVDPETGEERPIEPTELRSDRGDSSASQKSAQSRGAQSKRPARGRREPQPPSWRRVWKRTAMFAPIFAIFIYWTGSSSKNGVSLFSILVSTVVLVAFFAPFSYVVDSMAYRMWVKRTGRPASAKPDRPSKRR